MQILKSVESVRKSITSYNFLVRAAFSVFPAFLLGHLQNKNAVSIIYDILLLLLLLLFFDFFLCKLQYDGENQYETVVTTMALTAPDVLNYHKHHVRINHT